MMLYQLTLTSEELATLPAGLRAKARRKHERKPKQGPYRSALVTFADGEQIRAGSYAVDEATALQRIESFARAAYAWMRIRTSERASIRAGAYAEAFASSAYTYGEAYRAKERALIMPQVGRVEFEQEEAACERIAA